VFVLGQGTASIWIGSSIVIFEGIASTFSWILLRFLGKFDMVSKKHSTRSYYSMYVCVCVCVCVGPSIINRTRDNVVFVFGSLLDLGHVHLRDGLR
jgi:hypothetical protein